MTECKSKVNIGNVIYLEMHMGMLLGNILLNMKIIREGEHKGLRSNCVVTGQDQDSGMSWTYCVQHRV